jgi:hypothetical protein
MCYNYYYYGYTSNSSYGYYSYDYDNSGGIGWAIIVFAIILPTVTAVAFVFTIISCLTGKFCFRKKQHMPSPPPHDIIIVDAKQFYGIDII